MQIQNERQFVSFWVYKCYIDKSGDQELEMRLNETISLDNSTVFTL